MSIAGVIVTVGSVFFGAFIGFAVAILNKGQFDFDVPLPNPPIPFARKPFARKIAGAIGGIAGIIAVSAVPEISSYAPFGAIAGGLIASDIYNIQFTRTKTKS